MLTRRSRGTETMETFLLASSTRATMMESVRLSSLLSSRESPPKSST